MYNEIIILDFRETVEVGDVVVTLISSVIAIVVASLLIHGIRKVIYRSS